MKRDDYEFAERISLDLRARRAARKILGVTEDAGERDLKSAYRRASLKYHPDHNPHNPDAKKKFLLVKCAYELLAEDKPSQMVLDEIRAWSGVPEDERYELDNLWGHFLWWRDKFFE
jgi:DnaJ-class molecular chaperone